MKRILVTIVVIIFACSLSSCDRPASDKSAVSPESAAITDSPTVTTPTGNSDPLPTKAATENTIPSVTATPPATAIPTETVTASVTAVPVITKEPSNIAESSPVPEGTGKIGSEVILAEEVREKLGILIKWIYNNNLIYAGKDYEIIELPERMELLSSDEDKMRFAVNVIVFGKIIDADEEDGMTYTFTAEEADSIINSAVGDSFSEHKANDYIGSYSDGIYSYSMVGADGAFWWPDININSLLVHSDNEVLVKGILSSKHDAFPEIYTFDFEAIVVKNPDSLFGGYTLKELSVTEMK